MRALFPNMWFFNPQNLPNYQKNCFRGSLFSDSVQLDRAKQEVPCVRKTCLLWKNELSFDFGGGMHNPHQRPQLFENSCLHKFLTDSFVHEQICHKRQLILTQQVFTHKSFVYLTLLTKNMEIFESIRPKVENHHKFPLFLLKVKGTSIEYRWGADEHAFFNNVDQGFKVN